MNVVRNMVIVILLLLIVGTIGFLAFRDIPSPQQEIVEPLDAKQFVKY